MAELTYEDFKQRVNIQDLLADAGYQLNRRDGLRYPSYIKIGSDGKRVRGDKFIVTGNGMCCWRPSAYKNYNVISFIKEHPHFFSEYTPGMNTDRLVNLVCNRLLHQPLMDRPSVVAEKLRPQRVFDINRYERLHFKIEDWESQKAFYPYFKYRGINLDTQRDFRNNFFIALREGNNGKRYANLSFPLSRPGNPGTFVGLEERSRANAEGKTIYKGMAAGSNATEGLWIANLSREPLHEAKDVYWFESAYDAMAYYQIKKEQLMEDAKGNDQKLNALEHSIYLSTSGNPSLQQFKGMLRETPDANHHLCFDRDMAGKMFAVNFLIAKDNKGYKTSLPEKGTLQIDTDMGKYCIPIGSDSFSLDDLDKDLGFHQTVQPHELTEYLKTITPGDLFSGDPEYLEGPIGHLYGKSVALAEEYSSVSFPYRQLCDEDLADLKRQMNETYSAYRAALKESYNGYLSAPKVIYEPCNYLYKDWNDQLLDKKLIVEESQEKSADGVRDDREESKTVAISEDKSKAIEGRQEQEEEQEEEEEEEEDNQYHFHR